MSAYSGIGLPGRVKLRKPRHMTRTKAQRLRFGILAARHALERDRLTYAQVEFFENCRELGWRKEDAWNAYRREAIGAARRANAWM